LAMSCWLPTQYQDTNKGTGLCANAGAKTRLAAAVRAACHFGDLRLGGLVV
jgi:hypothetical protein